LAAIHGSPRVEEVELVDLDSGRTRSVACDTVVFTADWIPDHELAVTGGLELDPGTRGPRVDTGLRTARAGVLAAGNLLHGAEPADVAALSGRHAAATAAGWLADPGAWPAPRVPIACEPPLAWISPNALGPQRGEPPRGCFALRPRVFRRRAAIDVRQDGRVLWAGRIGGLVPGRSASLPSGWIAAVDAAGGTVVVRLADR
jgi:hypothetical protein